MIFHPEVLSQAQLAVLPALGRLASDSGFYLGGGTAVALHLGHRRSEDFDWLLPGKLAEPMILAAEARSAGLSVENVQVARGTLHAAMNDVRVSFFEYPYPLLSPLSDWPECSSSLASLEDLGCMKLAAIAQRGSRKDFIDLYFIDKHMSLDRLLSLYGRKYSTDDINHVLIGLSYFDDAEEEPCPDMLVEIPWGDVKRRFRDLVSRLAR